MTLQALCRRLRLFSGKKDDTVSCLLEIAKRRLAMAKTLGWPELEESFARDVAALEAMEEATNA